MDKSPKKPPQRRLGMDFNLNEDISTEPIKPQAMRLAAAQKRLLIECVVQFHDVRAVREELLRLDPDFPPIDDRLVRYYRDQIRDGKIPWVTAFRNELMQSGLMSAPTRISVMQRRYWQLSELLIRRYEVVSPNGTTQMVIETDANIARELREIEKQLVIEDELFTRKQRLIQPTTSNNAPKNDRDDDDQASRQQAAEVIEKLVNERTAMREALAGSQRPIALTS